MISQTAEYALRAMVFLADNHGESFTSEKISAGTQVPVSYLSKILQQLSRAELIHSQRGRHGGFSASQETLKLSLYDVIQAVDPIHRINSCPLELETHGTNLCPLHQTLDQVLGHVERTFKRVTIQSLLRRGRGSSYPLCEFPRQDIEDAEPVRREQ